MERQLHFVSQEVLNCINLLISTLIYKSSVVPTEIPVASSHLLKTLSELLEPRIAKAISKTTALEDTHIMLPTFKTHYKTVVVNTVCGWN